MTISNFDNMVPYLEYGNELRGGLWYYTQNRPGSRWVDQVDNSTGWTIDFTLTVENVFNSELNLDPDKEKGAGIYVNDGAKQEVINFMTQEINLVNANKSFTFDTTSKTHYRITGKDSQISLYGRKTGQRNYEEIGKSLFNTPASCEKNGLKPRVFEDIEGKLHATWYDDGSGQGKIYYATFDNNQWSNPEIIAEDVNGSQYPDIIVDPQGIVYVAYESKYTNGISIGLIYKNDIGWSNPIYFGVNEGSSTRPGITFDSQYNVYVVWQDTRLTRPEIYLSGFRKEQQDIIAEVKLTNSSYGSENPSITSYLDKLFVAWKHKNNDDASEIRVLSYSVPSNAKSSYIIVSSKTGNADYPDILCNVAGKVFVAWHDDILGKYCIYMSVLTQDLYFLNNNRRINIGQGESMYPVLAEQQSTSNVYIVWHDFKCGDYRKFTPIEPDPYQEEDPYHQVPEEKLKPLDYTIYIAYYDNLNNQFVSSNSGSFDVKLVFDDDRSVEYPGIPPLFREGLMILHETYMMSEYGFVSIKDSYKTIHSSWYDLSRDSEDYLIDHTIETTDPYYTQKDFLVSSILARKEIKFGDFSDTLNVHYIFENIKYYTRDAVEPLKITELEARDFSLISSLNALDATINNYGDVWIVGTCGTAFYMRSCENMFFVGESANGEEVYIPGPTDKNFRSIAFDKNSYLYIGGANGVKVSPTHIHGFLDGYITAGDVTYIAFDKDNMLWVGMSNGIKKVSLQYNFDNNTNLINVTGSDIDLSSLENYPSEYITSIKVDNNHMVWIGTKNGLYRYYKDTFLRFSTSDGLSSNMVNDIAIRNTAIRYIATSNGISKMFGNTFYETLSSASESIYNNNVKSILWQDPNIIWASTLSQINQITVDDINDTYSVYLYEPHDNEGYTKDDLYTYYLLPPDNVILSKDDIYEVYINGNKVEFGYVIGVDKDDSNQRLIRFKTPLKSNDVVEVIVRKDLEQKSRFTQTEFEREQFGNKITRINELLSIDDNIYSITYGTQNAIKVNDSSGFLPFDSIHFDATPPRFRTEEEATADGDDAALDGIFIGEQLDRSKVRVNIRGATDGPGGSGIKDMIVSNYSNFTTDGNTPQNPVPFNPVIIHDLGLSLEEVVKENDFTDESGFSLAYFSDINEYYAGTAQGGSLYHLVPLGEGGFRWEKLIEYGDEYIVDFIAYHNNNIIVSVGHPTLPAFLYIYTYIPGTENTSSSLSQRFQIPVDESRIHCFVQSEGSFYIGTGLGDGDEYNEYGAGEAGGIYKLESDVQGIYLSRVVNNIDNDIFSMVSIPGNDNIFATTGQSAATESGLIVEANPIEGSFNIIFRDSERILSSGFVDINDEGIIFTGGERNGVVRRSRTDTYSFDISFRGISNAINSMRVRTNVDGTETLFMSVGSILYYLSASGTWVWKYTHDEIINDFSFAQNGEILVISDGKITRIKNLPDEKNIYLKLIDWAGNESTQVADKFTDSINISNLINFVNENRILQLDENGNIVFSLSGDDDFYSANLIEKEKGVYLSEIFDGTDFLVKWQNISWETTEPYNTEVKIYVRASSSKDNLLRTSWSGPFYKNQSSGVDLSSLSGQYIQFKSELSSTQKGISPALHRVSIRAVIADAVHFFTTNFILPSRITQGILTSQKILPVAADIVFGINTTNSVDWSDYQIIEENRLFNVNQIGTNLRIGIKFLTPSIGAYEPSHFDEYGPYNSELFVNTVDFTFQNNTGNTNSYFFKITLYEDFMMQNEVYSAYSYTNPDGFSVNGEAVPEDGIELNDGESVNMLFTVPGSANIECNQYYFVKVESTYQPVADIFDTILDGYSFIIGCSSSFIDVIDFNFRNSGIVASDFHFRIRFYEDSERTNLYKTVFSGNDRSGWFADDIQIPEDGVAVNPDETVNVVYRPDTTDFVPQKLYHLTIDAYDGTEYVYTNNSYTFQVRDVSSDVYCGGYFDIPIVKNFGLMFELDNKEQITINM